MENNKTTPTLDKDELLFDYGKDELHDPALYTVEAEAEKWEGYESIDAGALDTYQRDGFMAVEHFFSTTAVENAKAGIVDLVMGRYPDYFASKKIMFETRARERLASMGPEERQDAVRKLMSFIDVEERLTRMGNDPRLLDAVSRLMGGLEPVIFQDMAMLKPPSMGREKPWHQDHAYFDLPLGTPVVGVWIALDAATRENGCMHMLPGKQHEPIIHFNRRDWQICDREMLGQRCVAVPLQPGGVLFFDSLCPHGTPHNHSGLRRRAVQFHYAPKDAVKCAAEERMAHFGSEGKDVTC